MRRQSGEKAASSLLLAELFESGDRRFLEELLTSQGAAGFRSLAERWYRDQRPDLREALLAYVDDGCDRPHHRPLVKRLFKLAEAAGDDEAMGHFLVAFDRLAARRLASRPRWDWQNRRTYNETVLIPDSAIPSSKQRAGKAGRFTMRTRRYLVRRAFRYFRVLGREERPRFGRAVRSLLAIYRDEHLSKPENILNAWGLVHLLYRNSGVLLRPPNGIVLAPGKKLSELTPAPIYPDVWTGCLDEILDLAERARSRTVRVWCLALLRRDYDVELQALSLPRVVALLKSAQEELQELGARLLESVPNLENLPVGGWLELFRLENPVALELVCERERALLSPERLSLAQCVDLACARPAPGAELGLAWTKERELIRAGDLDEVCRLSSAESPRVRQEATPWLVELLRTSPAARPENVRDLLDARHADVRETALTLPLASERYRDEVSLWSALAESPYADVRSALVQNLRKKEAVLEPGSLLRVWASTLLSINGGGRSKRTAVNRIAERVAQRPSEVDDLLPLLRIALRSIRPAEQRTALAAISRAAFRNHALRSRLSRAIPELALFDEAIA